MIDPRDAFQKISTSAKDAIIEQFPIQGKINRLQVDNVEVAPPDYSIEDEYDAKYNNKTLSVPVYATLSLVDKDGKVIDQKKRHKMMDLPVFTNRGSFLVDGHEYTVAIQNRKRPGVYPQLSEAGEVVGSINSSHGLAAKTRITLNPETSKFHLNLDSSNPELLPVLRAIGVQDNDIRRVWGDAVFDANNNAISPKVHDKAIKDAARKFTGKSYDTVEEAGSALRAKMDEITLDKDINKRTIGVDSDKLDFSVLLGTTNKLLKINRGEDSPVDMNSLEFKDFLWVDDFIKERVKLEARKFRNKIAKLSDNATKVDEAITPSILTKTVKGFFTDASLSELSDQYNPLDIHSSVNKVTTLGEGAITDLRTAGEDIRALHQSTMGILDPIQTPESEKIGLMLHLAAGAKKEGKKLRVTVYNTRTGQMEEVDHDKLAASTVALPGKSIKNVDGKFIFTEPEMRASKGGKMDLVPVKDIQYIIPRPQMLFSQAVNMVPFLNNNAGPRMFMGSKQIGQSLPVTHREEPLVQSGVGQTSFEKHMGAAASVRTPVTGTVTRVENSRVYIQDATGVERAVPFYKDFPLNHDHVYDTELLVKPGDKVNAGQIIGDSNFTRNGALALGQNLRSLYIADGGYNFEDGITISEGAAKKLASVHMYKKDFRPGKDIYQFPDKYLSQFPNKFKQEQLAKIDERGVIKEGMEVQPGDPLVMAMRQASLDDENLTASQISKKLQRPWRDATQYWDGDGPGTVTKVVKKEDGSVRVYVKAIETGQIADKLAGRFGNKGVVARILPDEKMPRDKEGQPFEILLSPFGVTGRANPGQLYEAALGKVAKKNGTPYVIENFKHDNVLEFVKGELKKNGFAEDGTEEVFDADGNKLGRAMAGYSYILKLAKQAKTGFSARGAGSGEPYDSNKTPASGGEDGAKALDVLSIYAMLSHGAKANLREMSTDKATQNPEFWNAVRNGAPLPAPKPTFAYEKFMNYLKGAGVNVERRGDYLQLLPFTDDDILANSGGTVTKAKFVNAKDLKAKKGGFMDPQIFGKDGQRWGHIELSEPIINPVFKDGLRAIMGITEDQLSAIPPRELVKTIRGMDLDKLEADVQAQLNKTTSPQTEDKLNKRLRYIKALKESGIKPEKAYILTKYPVLPPNVRPIVGGEEDSDQIVSPVNFLYRDLVLSNEALNSVKKIPYLPARLRHEMEANLQKSVDAVAGITAPVGNYTKERTPAGLVEQIKGAGDTPSKMGFFQRKVLRKTLDVTGRGVITPDPHLGLDEVGLPEDMAWTSYKPFVEARMRRVFGMNHADIIKNIEARTPIARKALENEMKDRPVIMNRAPTLHKFGMLGFNPFLSNGKTIRIPSLVVTGYNADFDGDAMTMHIPARPEAVAEVREKMMASNNLFSNRAGDLVMTPKVDPILGIYRASKSKEGVAQLQKMIPAEFHELIKPNMNKKDIQGLLSTIAQADPASYKDVARKLNVFGNEVAFKTASTLHLGDLDVKDPAIKHLRNQAFREYYKFRNDPRMVNEILGKYDKAIQERLLTHDKNNLIESVKAGASSKMAQIKQMIGAGVQYTNANKSPIPIPVLSNFAEGMGVNDYWITQFSSRRGMIDRKMETEEPGAFAKQLLISITDKLIGDPKDLTDDGEEFDVMDKNAFGRYIAQDVIVKGKTLAKKGDILTPKKAAMLKQGGADKINIHTILSSNTGSFIDPKAWGLTREGKLLDPGANIGALAGQAIAEPMQQGAMNSFHTGGVVGTKDLQGFDKLKKILLLPENVSNQATLSSINGKVQAIDRNPAGGYNVTVNGQKMFVKPGLPVTVKVGEEVKAGQPVSDGFIHPKDMLEIKGIDHTRRFMTDSLMKSFGDMGMNVDRRNAEVVVKALTDSAKVVDPGDSDFIKGDIVNYDEVKAYNSAPPRAYEKEDENLVGKVLVNDINGYPAGTVVTEEMIKHLPNTVEARNNPVKVNPLLLGITQKPRKASDWITNLGYGYIKSSLEQRAPAMEKAPIHGSAPLPAFVFGTEFGRGKWY